MSDDLLQDDLESIMADAAELDGATITLEDGEHPCEPGIPDYSISPELAGDAPDSSCTVLIRASEVGNGTVVKQGKEATYNGKRWRIASNRLAVDGLEYELTLSKISR